MLCRASLYTRRVPVSASNTSAHGRVIEPPFHEDRAGVVLAVTKLLELSGLTTVHVCHGGLLLPRAVEAWVKKQAAKLHVAREAVR